jgi:hypothetical protein
MIGNKNSKRISFSLVFGRLLTLAFILFIIYSFSSSDFSSFSSSEAKFPELTSPKEITYTWNYNGDDYSISKTLYSSVYDYYREKPIYYTYYSNDEPDDWVKDYYSMYLNTNEKDSSISDLLTDLKAEALKNDINEDETVELVLSFVQSINYDTALASQVLNGEETAGAKYPYMVLYENSGICSGKSFLAYRLLEELGYGVALFDYEADKHVTVAIKCDTKYSSYKSGYCYAETTARYPIGVFATFDEDNTGLALSATEYFDKNDTFEKDNELGDVRIYLQAEGKSYGGVKENVEKNNEILVLLEEVDRMEKVIKSLELEIASSESKIEDMSADLAYYDSRDSVYMYNLLVPQYNSLLDNLDDQIIDYKNYINSYNNKVDRVNLLIEDLYGEGIYREEL